MGSLHEALLRILILAVCFFANTGAANVLERYQNGSDELVGAFYDEGGKKVSLISRTYFKGGKAYVQNDIRGADSFLMASDPNENDRFLRYQVRSPGTDRIYNEYELIGTVRRSSKLPDDSRLISIYDTHGNMLEQYYFHEED